MKQPLQSRASHRPTHKLSTLVQFLITAGLASTLALGEYSHAQPTPSGHSQTSASYAIPAGTLSAVLTRFGAESGIALVDGTALVRDKNSPGLKGNYSIAGGFAAILADTNLEAYQRADGSYGLRQLQANPAGSAQSATSSALPVITIRPELSAADQAASNYTVKRSSSATKLDLAIKDTPQSITVITQRQIEEQNLQTVNQILEATPGITVSNFGVPGAGRATYYSRGYEINNVMVDGTPTIISSQRGMELLAGYDTFIYDRVEITRGSTGLSTGTGNPSASLNFSRKRPGKTAERTAKISYGSWDKKRAEVDLTQPLNDDGSVRGRLVAAYGKGGSYIDRIEEDSKIVYGIIEADLGRSTTLSVGATYFDKYIDNASPHMTAAATASSNSKGVFDGGPSWNAATDWSYSHIKNWNTFLTLAHDFNDQWKISANYQYSRMTPDRKWGLVGASWYDAKNNTASYSIGREKSESDIHNLDITLSGKFELFGREALIATGINGFSQDTYQPGYQTYSDNEPICGKGANYRGCVSLNGWDGSVPYPKNFSASTIRRQGADPLDGVSGFYDKTEKQYGFFLSTKFEPLQDLKVILGARYNHYEIEADGYILNRGKGAFIHSHAYNYSPDNKIIPYAGIIYDITPSVSAYASYTAIYKPQLNKNIHDEFLPFIEGNSYEAGIKSALLDDRLNLHAAIFRMQEKNVPYNYGIWPINPATGRHYSCTPVTDSSCTPQYAAEGPTISGLELSVQGQITPKWMINAGYTYMHVKRVESADSLYSSALSGGDYSFERPKHTFNLATSYAFTDKLTLGGALRWKSQTMQGVSKCFKASNGKELCTDSTNMLTNMIGNQGAFSVVDIMGRYRINDMMTLGVNIGNLFDKTYKANNISSVYGAPRNITVSLSSHF